MFSYSFNLLNKKDLFVFEDKKVIMELLLFMIFAFIRSIYK